MFWKTTLPSIQNNNRWYLSSLIRSFGIILHSKFFRFKIFWAKHLISGISSPQSWAWSLKYLGLLVWMKSMFYLCLKAFHHSRLDSPNDFYSFIRFFWIISGALPTWLQIPLFIWSIPSILWLYMVRERADKAIKHLHHTLRPDFENIQPFLETLQSRTLLSYLPSMYMFGGGLRTVRTLLFLLGC